MTYELSVQRMEKKYGLSLLTAQIMENKLRQVLETDEHDTLGGYLVRSLYFDTIDNSDYFDKADGYEQRSKVRLRIYSPDDESAKLELKQKIGERQLKRSLSVSRKDAIKLSEGDYTPLVEIGTPFALEMYSRMTSRLYRPVSIVEYKRTAFIAPANDTRITLDRALSATEASMRIFDKELMTYPVALLDNVTLEVKYNNFLLSYVKDMLELHSYPQSSISKYCAARQISMMPE